MNASDWVGAASSATSSFASVYAAIKGSQAQQDALNKQSEMQDRAYNYQLMLGDQAAKNTKIYVIVGAVALVVLLFILKR
ncbi:MAG: hypothetical protein JST36_07530 [Bacteroidetes bacterium]|nr:hypothetical protein [Bacteroidota bacterium]